MNNDKRSFRGKGFTAAFCLALLLAQWAFCEGPAVYQPTSLDFLGSYDYVPPGLEAMEGRTHKKRAGHNGIPDNVFKLNHSMVSVQGYVMPTDVAGDRMKQFILVKSRANCCYGLQPKYNDWILVTVVEPKGWKIIQDIPVVIYGKLDMGEKYEHGESMGLYRMLADRMEIAPKPGGAAQP